MYIHTFKNFNLNEFHETKQTSALLPSNIARNVNKRLRKLPRDNTQLGKFNYVFSSDLALILCIRFTKAGGFCK